MITVGEAWGATPEIAKKYSNPDGSEFSMVFQFEHIMLDQEEGKEKWDTIPLNMVKLKKCLAKWQNTLYQTGWNSLFMNNHDLPRIVSRWGNDGKYRKRVGKNAGDNASWNAGNSLHLPGRRAGNDECAV